LAANYYLQKYYKVKDNKTEAFCFISDIHFNVAITASTL